jgi:hypothetical protein
MTTAKERIQRDLQGDLFARNHPTRSYFRGWLDGSYLGERHYNYNLGKIKPHVHKSGAALEKALRPFVINAFCAYTAHDAQCSYGYAQKVIVETLDKETLERLNAALVEDAVSLAEELA